MTDCGSRNPTPSVVVFGAPLPDVARGHLLRGRPFRSACAGMAQHRDNQCLAAGPRGFLACRPQRTTRSTQDLLVSSVKWSLLVALSSPFLSILGIPPGGGGRTLTVPRRLGPGRVVARPSQNGGHGNVKLGFPESLPCNPPFDTTRWSDGCGPPKVKVDGALAASIDIASPGKNARELVVGG